jgi:hypothetical protein
MKAVSLQTGLSHFAWKGHKFSDRRLAPMKAGIETGHLLDAGQSFHRRLDDPNVVGLMKWSQWNKLSQLIQNGGIYSGWSGKTRSAVNHAVADPEHT